MSFSAYIGTLHESLADVAWRIHHLPTEIPIVVWADTHDQVLAAAADSAPGISPDAFVGNYGRARSVQSIESDLRATLRERLAKSADGSRPARR